MLWILEKYSLLAILYGIKGYTLQLSTKAPQIFASLDVLYDSYLNQSDMATFRLGSAYQCMLACLQIPGCQSTNLNKLEQICMVLNANHHSNSSLFISKENWQHVFIKSACDSSPCRNGATCHPNFMAATFQCLCPESSAVYRVEGEFCGNVKVGLGAAQWYTRFSVQKGQVKVNGPVARVQVGERYTPWDKSEAKLVRSPERRQHVFYMFGGKTGLKFKTDGLQKCTRIVTLCQGSALTAWVKIPRFDPKNPIVFASTGVTSGDGLYIGYRMTQRLTCVVTVKDSGYMWNMVEWKTSDELKWWHLGCVYDKDDAEKVIFYINGKRQVNNIKDYARTRSPPSVTLNWLYIGENTPRSVQIGKGAIDAVGLWDTPLTEKEMAMIFITP